MFEANIVVLLRYIYLITLGTSYRPKVEMYVLNVCIYSIGTRMKKE